MYISRAIFPRLKEFARHFPVVLLCGARQTGKTTLLKKLNEESGGAINYVTLDYPRLRLLARSDPELFLQQYGEGPLIIDEIQYAPELLPYIKIRVDEDGRPGRFFLTGSQMFHLMADVSESLAGRVGVLPLYSLSRAELLGYGSAPFVPERLTMKGPAEPAPRVFERILRGSMPKTAADPELPTDDFYGLYVQTYLERYIRALISVRDEDRFLRFIGSAAARTGQELNVSDLARDAEIDAKTAESWLSLLVSSGLVFLLRPWSGNTIKRLVKRPKLYFMDTGLVCNLSLWSDAGTLMNSAASGALFETYVFSEIVKSWANAIDVRSRFSYYRDAAGREVDLLIQSDGIFYPVEIKKSADPGREALKNFSALDDLKIPVGRGAVVCLSPILLPLDEKNTVAPLSCI